ncbi:hypothetical protein Rhe02_36190 [Rhizocola hellebori]|uniref:Uncharacterized protein n=1 Tax=Rhizocola hellebori TaxID=1392758 RepID=A0A8J3Q907_9ACTN|nr:hypothetical protein [Rhizocola hellebori]GIH05552.1 hypothetical protein Rhe02_36190 [Rhizocola hellebori]
MSDQQDWIARAMSGLANDDLPSIAPPGVAAVSRSVARRKRLRAGLVAAVVMLGLLTLVPFVSARDGAGPVAPPTTPAATPTAPSPSPSVSAVATPDATPTPGLSAAAQPGNGQKSKAPPQPTCAVDGRVTLTDVSYSAATAYLATNASADQILCPGGQARVFWATYTVDANQIIHLYRWKEYFLTWENPEVRMQVESPPLEPCVGTAYYYVAGRQPIVTSVKVTDPGNPAVQPYPVAGPGTGKMVNNLTPACPPSP